MLHPPLIISAPQTLGPQTKQGRLEAPMPQVSKRTFEATGWIRLAPCQPPPSGQVNTNTGCFAINPTPSPLSSADFQPQQKEPATGLAVRD